MRNCKKLQATFGMVFLLSSHGAYAGEGYGTFFRYTCALTPYSDCGSVDYPDSPDVWHIEPYLDKRSKQRFSYKTQSVLASKQSMGHLEVYADASVAAQANCGKIGFAGVGLQGQSQFNDTITVQSAVAPPDEPISIDIHVSIQRYVGAEAQSEEPMQSGGGALMTTGIVASGLDGYDFISRSFCASSFSPDGCHIIKANGKSEFNVPFTSLPNGSFSLTASIYQNVSVQLSKVNSCDVESVAGSASSWTSNASKPAIVDVTLRTNNPGVTFVSASGHQY